MQIVNSIPSHPDLVLERNFNYDPDLYYGVRIGKEAGIIHRRSYNSGVFSIFCVNALTRGNCISSFDCHDLRSMVQSILAYGEKSPRVAVKVCVFDTFAELAAFLVDKSPKNI